MKTNIANLEINPMSCFDLWLIYVRNLGVVKLVKSVLLVLTPLPITIEHHDTFDS